MHVRSEPRERSRDPNNQITAGGAGIFNVGGDATVNDSVFTENNGRLGGAIFSTSISGPIPSLTVTNSTFTNNTTRDGPGGAIYSSGDLTVTNSTFSNNRSLRAGGSGLPSAGGAIFSGRATVTNSSFNANSADGGGAITSDHGSITVTDSTFADNAAGAIDTVGSSMTVANCTFSGNRAGFLHYGGINAVGDANVTVANSTFSGNIGGIFAAAGSLTVINSTFSRNDTELGAFAVIANVDATVVLRNTIVVDSIGGDNCKGSLGIARIIDGGSNIDDGTSCGFRAANGSFSNTEAHLDPAGLQDNGGPTQTVALCTAVGIPAGCTAVSPAINAGDLAGCAAAPVSSLDQRGFGRPGAGRMHCSIGAYEADAIPPITVNDTSDDAIATDGKCTLREAIANVNAASDTSGGDCTAGMGLGSDAIVFDLPLPATITLTTNTELAIDRNVTISGPTSGAVAIDGNSGSTRVFHIKARVNIANLTIQNGGAPGGGGMLIDDNAVVTLANCTVSGNSGTEAGGGIQNDGTAYLINSTLHDNAGIGGGGIQNNGMAELLNCTLTANSATQTGGGAGIPGGIGGGILNNFNGVATLTNCTISGNSASGAGGILNLSGTAQLFNCTVSGNHGGGVFSTDPFDTGGTATLTNTIVANSIDGDNCAGDLSLVDGGHNLSSDDTCFTAPSLLNTDPGLAPLANYGGPTATFALCTAAGTPDPACSGPSPAIDAGDRAICSAAPVFNFDQRGVVRLSPGDSRCSIGAFEADAGEPEICVGDCNGNYAVAVNELVLGVNIVLETQPVTACSAFQDSQGIVNVAQLVAGVNNALKGCGG